jgi:hypothetical protein
MMCNKGVGGYQGATGDCSKCGIWARIRWGLGRMCLVGQLWACLDMVTIRQPKFLVGKLESAFYICLKETKD